MSNPDYFCRKRKNRNVLQERTAGLHFIKNHKETVSCPAIKVFYKKEVTFHFLLHADCRVSFFPLLWFEGDSNPTLFCWASPDLGGRPRTSEPVSEPEPSHSWFSPLGFQMGEPKRINWFQTEIKLKRDLNTGKQNKCSLAGGCGFFYFKKIMVKRKSP